MKFPNKRWVQNLKFNLNKEEYLSYFSQLRKKECQLSHIQHASLEGDPEHKKDRGETIQDGFKNSRNFMKIFYEKIKEQITFFVFKYSEMDITTNYKSTFCI